MRKLLYNLLIVGILLTPSFGATARPPKIRFKKDDPLRSVLKKLTNKESTADRQRAADQIARMGDTRAVPWLKWALEDEKPAVRTAAVTSLGLLRVQESQESLAHLLQSDKDPNVRQACATALYRLGNSSSIPVFIEALSDTSDGVRFSAAQALGAFRSKKAVPDLLKTLTEVSASMRRIAAKSLGDIGDTSAAPGLRPLLTDPHQDVRRSAARALGILKDSESIVPLKKLLKDSNEGVRVSAAFALGNIGNRSGRKVALAVLKTSNSPSVRARAAQALATIGDPSAIPALKKVAQEGNTYLNQHAQAAVEILELKTKKSSNRK